MRKRKEKNSAVHTVWVSRGPRQKNSSSHPQLTIMGFPGGSVGKESACNAGDPCLIPGLGKFPGEGNGNPLQYSCLENSMGRGAWQSTVHIVTRVRHDLANKPPPKLLPDERFSFFF